MSSSVLAIDRHRDESAADRFFNSHRIAMVGVLVGVLAWLVWFAKIDGLSDYWVWVALVALVALVLSVIIDPLIAVWTRWDVVAADVGLIGRRGGVPARWVVYPAGWRSVGLIVSPDSILPEDWDKALPRLARGFGYERAVIEQNRRRVRLVFSNAASPLDRDYSLALDLDNQQVLIGIDESGKNYWLDTDNHSGVIVAGIPGSGKTVFLRRIAQTFASNPANFVVVFDGKGTDDFEDLAAKNLRVLSGTPDDDGAILDTLERLGEKMKNRAKTGKNSGRVVIIVDESQGFFACKGLTSEEKKARERSAALLLDFIRRGRSLGFLTVLSTQKPDSDSLPTVVRDNAGLRAAGRLRTSEAEKMALGDNHDLTRSLTVGQMVIDDGKNLKQIKVGTIPSPGTGGY